MRSNMYSIFDSVSEVFNKPFLSHNDGDAIRSFTDAAKEQPHIKDYVLYCVGEFNDNNGTITAQENPVKIYSGLDIKTANLTSITMEQQRADLDEHEKALAQ